MKLKYPSFIVASVNGGAPKAIMKKRTPSEKMSVV
jgi:hypothetical protein